MHLVSSYYANIKRVLSLILSGDENLEHVMTHIGETQGECQLDYSRLSRQLAVNSCTALAANGVYGDAYGLRFEIMFWCLTGSNC